MSGHGNNHQGELKNKVHICENILEASDFIFYFIPIKIKSYIWKIY